MVAPFQGEIYVNSSRQVTIIAEDLFGVDVIIDNVDANEEWKELDGKQVRLLMFLMSYIVRSERLCHSDRFLRPIMRRSITIISIKRTSDCCCNLYCSLKVAVADQIVKSRQMYCSSAPLMCHLLKVSVCISTG